MDGVRLTWLGVSAAAAELAPLRVAVMNLIIGAAAFVSSLTGFGYALVASPCMVLLFPPRTAVPVTMLSWVPLAAALTWEARRQMEWGRIGRWMLGAAVGIPLGVYGLATASEGIMRAAIGAASLLAAGTLWLKPSRPFRREGLLAPLAGAMSGLMGGATGMSGPPVILFGLNQGWQVAALRANLIGYFAAKNLLSLAFLAEFGVLAPGTVALGLAALPGMAVGYWAGMRLRERVSARRFRALALGLVAAAALLALLRH